MKKEIEKIEKVDYLIIFCAAGTHDTDTKISA